MYLGQFLDYIHPIYHFRVLKVPSLSTHKDESIIFVFCTTLYVIEIIEEKHVLLAQDFYDSTYSPTYVGTTRNLHITSGSLKEFY